MRTVDRLEFSVSNDVMFTHIHSLKQGKDIFGVVHVQREITGMEYCCGCSVYLQMTCSQSECSLGEALMSSINSLTESVSMAT